MDGGIPWQSSGQDKGAGSVSGQGTKIPQTVARHPLPPTPQNKTKQIKLWMPHTWDSDSTDPGTSFPKWF